MEQLSFELEEQHLDATLWREITNWTVGGHFIATTTRRKPEPDEFFSLTAANGARVWKCVADNAPIDVYILRRIP